MKQKLISLLCAIFLCTSVGRAADFSYSTISSSYMHTSVEWTNNAGTVQVIDWYWNPDGYTDEWVELMFIVNVSEKYDYGNVVGPAPGTYRTFYSGTSLSNNPGCLSSNSNYPCNAKEYNGYNYSSWTLISGSVVVEQGMNGKPYVDIQLQTAKGGRVYVKCGEQLPKYTVSADYTTGGYISSSTGATSGSYTEGSCSPTYTAHASTGYIFDGWYDAGWMVSKNASYQVCDIQTAHTLHAQFVPSVGGTITIESDGNGSVNTAAGGSYNGGDRVNLTATPADGYMFVMWKKDGVATDLSQNATVICSGNATYTAVFKRKIQVSVTSNDKNKGTATIYPASVSGYYYEGQNITLTATPIGLLNSFTQWNDGNSQNPRVVTVSGDATYTAEFNKVDAVEIIDDNGVLYNKDYGFIEGKTDGYSFHFESWNAPLSVSNNYTAIDEDYTKLFASSNFTNQKAINFSTMHISIAKEYVNANMYFYVFESTFYDTDGQLYYVKIKAIGPMTADNVDTDEDFNGGTYSQNPQINKVGDRRYRLWVDGGNWSGFSYGYDAQIDFILDDQDAIGGTIPAGVYPITCTGESKTVAMPEYPIFSYTSSYSTSSVYAEFDGSYTRYFYLNSGGGIGNIWWHYLCGGTVTVTRSGDSYNISVDATCSAANPNQTNPSRYYKVQFNVMGIAAPTAVTHTVTFNNYDGTQLQSGQVEEGQKPSYSGTPTKSSTVDKVYTFTGWKSSIDAQVYATANLPAVGTSDVTYTAQFSESTRQYTITINTPTNGSIKVMNGQTEVTTGNKVDYNTALTVTATPADHYHFVAWTDNGDSNIIVNADKTIGATFAIDTYTLTMNACTGGTYSKKIGDATATTATSEKTVETVPYGTEVILQAHPTEHFMFTGWQLKGETEETDNPFVFTMTKDVEYQATFESSLASHTLTLYPTMSAGSTGIIQVKGAGQTFTSPTNSEDPVVCTVYESIEYTCQLISNDNNSWGWWLEDDGSILSSEQEMKITPTDDVVLYAGFGLKHVKLEGTGKATDYDDYLYTMIHELEYVRVFNAKTWSTMWMPFGFDVAQQGLSGKIYTLSKSAVEEQVAGIIDVALTFHKYSDGNIEAGEPCIFYSTQAITNFVFHDVLMENLSPVDTYVGTGNERVRFFGIAEKSTLGGTGSEALQKSYRYLSSNVLYYPSVNVGVNMDAFRACFQIVNYEHWYGEGASSAPRMRIIVDDETVITEAETDTEVKTRKYINDEGNLIIECNGTKYTANGAITE